MSASNFKKNRDEFLEEKWNEIEPFGFDHPDTYRFIKDMMDWSYHWCLEHYLTVSKRSYEFKIRHLEQKIKQLEFQLKEPE